MHAVATLPRFEKKRFALKLLAQCHYKPNIKSLESALSSCKAVNNLYSTREAGGNTALRLRSSQQNRAQPRLLNLLNIA